MKISATSTGKGASVVWKKLDSRRERIIRKLREMGECDMRRGMLSFLTGEERRKIMWDEEDFDDKVRTAAESCHQSALQPFSSTERHFETVLNLAACVERQLQWLELIIDRASSGKTEKEIAPEE